ncbi:hypothetical protein MHU86_19876 [Fragilaria crotonensis]|nr:hypothetical protein MHU86_19876 [Fragilaria crotonensis]
MRRISFHAYLFHAIALAILTYYCARTFVEVDNYLNSYAARSSIESQPLITWNGTKKSNIKVLPARMVSKRINLSACPAEHRIVVAPKVNVDGGIGHRMTQALFVFRHAMTHGYCFSFPNRTLQETTFDNLENQDVALVTNGSSFIQWIDTQEDEVWPVDEQNQRAPGCGDVYAFVDNFLRDNHLLDEVVIPWYQRHTRINTAFRKTHNKTTNGTLRNDDGDVNSIALNASFHLRVGDIVLEKSESYWRNVVTTMMNIVDLEVGSGCTVHVYWLYFPADHRGEMGSEMRKSLDKNVVGEWPSKPNMLPESHRFLANLCREFDRVKCHWKLGTNLLESIDLFVRSDLVYISGSSFSQLLSLFSQGIRLVAITKELNREGSATKGSVPFLSISTNGFSSLRYYYIDGTGELFDEHYAYLQVNQPNDTAT